MFLSRIRVLAALGFLTAVTGLVAAQDDRAIDAVLDIMPDMADRFESVDELMSEKKWGRALDKLAEIVDEAGDTVWSEGGKVYVSVREYVRRRIMTMPEEGLAFYRLRVDGEARALLLEGLAAQDVGRLDELEIRYPASSFAPTALDAAANLLMDRGNYAGATARLERLLAMPRSCRSAEGDAELRAMGLVKLAFCASKLGDVNAAAAAVDRLRRLGLGDGVRLGGGSARAQTFIQSQLDRGPVKPVVVPGVAWPSAGGFPSHARPMLDVRPNLSRRWQVKIGDDSPTPKPPARSRVSAAHYRYGRQQGMQVSPLAVTDEEGVVYVNTGRGLFALDHITGRRRWVARPKAAPMPVQRGGVVVRFLPYNRNLAAMWSRWPGAASASVGRGRVFATEVAGQGYQVYLALSAFKASSGKRLWSFVQRPDGADFETQAYFPWTPKLVEGQLIGMACHRDQMFLASLDPATGKINWKVFLAADPSRVMSIYGYRGLQHKFGQPVVVADGVAYAATGMGAIAAVDIRNGLLRWISKYPRSSIQVVKQKRGLGHYTHYRYKGGWAGGFPVVSRGKLYVSPWDADELLVFDCRTGAIVKRIPRGAYTYFAGCRLGDVILVGPKTVVAMDPRTGFLRWLVPMPPGFEPQGLPVLSETELLIPGKAKLWAIRLEGRPVRRKNPIPTASRGLPLGNIVSCEGRLIAANRAHVTGYFSFEETYAYLSKQITERPKLAKPMLDRADLCFLHKKYADTLKDLQMVEVVIGAQRPAAPALRARMKRMMFETRLKLSNVEKPKAVVHIDAARKYIFNDVARVRFHLARGAALSAVKRYQDAVDEYLAIVKNSADVKLEEDDTSSPVGVIAQGRIGELVRKHGGKVYARVDARLRPEFEKLVRAKDAEALRRMQLDHPHSSLADNCLLEIARIVEKGAFGAIRAQTLLRSLTLRYERSEVLGEAYAKLLSNCLRGKQYRLAALVMKDIREKHSTVQVPWEGRTLTGRDLVERLMAREEIQSASSALGRLLPALLPPLKQAWTSGSGPEVLVQVVSDDSCFDRGIGLAADVAMGPPPYQYYGKITRLRAFDTATGQTLWTAKVNVGWCLGDIESAEQSPWTRGKFRAIVVCSGSVVGLCHPEGIIALDLATGRQVWQKKWRRPASRNPMQWFDHNALRVDHRLRQVMNQRPVFAAEAGRIFYYVPDGTLACIDAAMGKDIWRVKRKGYASGGIGLFGDVVVVAGVMPNTLSAYSALNGNQLHSISLPGQVPSCPAYDRERNRILHSDGVSLSSYAAADLRREWRVADGQAVQQTQPWYIQPLPGNKIAACRYTRRNNQYGYGVVLYDGARKGRRLWQYGVNYYHRDNKTKSYTRINMCGPAAYGKRFAYMPTQTYRTIRKGRSSKQERSLAYHVLDLESGKKLREFKIQASGANPRHHVYPIDLIASAEHAVVLSRKYDGTFKPAMDVFSGETGKGVLHTGLGPSVNNQLQNLMIQRVRALVTADGGLLAPTGKGITRYSSTGTGASAEKKPEEKPNAKPNAKK